MVSAALASAVGVGVLLVVVLVYYANRPSTTPDACTATTACADKWFRQTDSGVVQVPAVQKCGPDLRIVQPYYGPGKCANPCSDNETPCWDSVNQFGICRPGKGPCSCAGDADCAGAAQSRCINGRCQCPPGFAGPNCDQKLLACDPRAPIGACGPNGSCVNGACVCHDGWESNIVARTPCSQCAAGRGPPVGSAGDPARWCASARYTGVVFPIPVGHVADPATGRLVQCTDINDDPGVTGRICNQYYPGATFAGGLFNEMCANTSCHVGDSPNLSGIFCQAPNGIWASPTFDVAAYKASHWGTATGCVAQLPDGWAGLA